MSFVSLGLSKYMFFSAVYKLQNEVPNVVIVNVLELPSD